MRCSGCRTDLPLSPPISAYLPISPHISPYLPLGAPFSSTSSDPGKASKLSARLTRADLESASA